MSEQYPTRAEIQEWLNEIWATDSALWEYLMLYEDEEPTAQVLARSPQELQGNMGAEHSD